MTTVSGPGAGLSPITVQRQELAELEGEWREIHPSCTLRNVFTSPTWLKAWWEEFAAGRELMLLSVRQAGALVGVVPLMRDQNTITFVGNTKVCDYMDLIAPRGREAEILSSMLRSLGEEPWSELSFWAVPEGSPTLDALRTMIAEDGLLLEVDVEDVCPQVDLPPSWDEYLCGLDKKDRHELRRKLRRLSQGGEVRLEVLEQPDDIAVALDDFLRLHSASRPAKAAFMTDGMERFLRRVTRSLAEEGLIELVFLSLSDTRAAGVLCFRGEDEVLLYNSGYDPVYAGLSVGLLSKALALQKAIEDGRKRFDFLRGAEPYKYDLGAKDRKVFRCVVRRS